MDYKLFVILGKFSSGKDTILKKMIETYGYKKVVSCTTRHKRPGEIDRIDYNFLTLDEFNYLKSVNLFLECRTFERVDGTFHYGTHIDVLDKLKSSHMFCIKNLNGALELAKNIGLEKVVPIYIEQNPFNRIYSSFLRTTNTFHLQQLSEKDVEESCRRFIADQEEFRDIDKIDIFKVKNSATKALLPNVVDQINTYITSGDYKYFNMVIL